MAKSNKKAKVSATTDLKRKSATLSIRKRILVVGEGVNTEPSYFKQFREPGLQVIAVGMGESTRKLVNDIERVQSEQEKKIGRKFDEVWAVFDKDSFNDFEAAISEARAKGYRVAYSNQAIEYWFILHFKDHQGSALARTEYAKVLNKLLDDANAGFHYDPDAKEVSEEMFDLMYKQIQVAFDRASRIYQSKLAGDNPTEESVTTIFQLVGSIKNLTTTEEKYAQRKKEESIRKAQEAATAAIQ